MNEFNNQPADGFSDFVEETESYEDTIIRKIPLLGIPFLKSPLFKTFKKNYIILGDFYRFAINYALSRPDDSLAFVYTKKMLSYNPYYTVQPEDDPRMEEFLKMLYPLPQNSIGLKVGGNYSNIYKNERYSTLNIYGLEEQIKSRYEFLPGFQLAIIFENYLSKNLSVSIEPGYSYQRINYLVDYSLLDNYSERNIPVNNIDVNMNFGYFTLPFLVKFRLIPNLKNIEEIYGRKIERYNKFLNDTAISKNEILKYERKRTLRELTSLYTPYKKWMPYIMLGGQYKRLVNSGYSSIDIPSIMNRNQFELTGGIGMRKYEQNNTLSFELRANYGLSKVNRASRRFSNETIVFSELDAIDDIWMYSIELNIIYLFNISYKAYDIRNQ